MEANKMNYKFNHPNLKTINFMAMTAVLILISDSAYSGGRSYGDIAAPLPQACPSTIRPLDIEKYAAKLAAGNPTDWKLIRKIHVTNKHPKHTDIHDIRVHDLKDGRCQVSYHLKGKTKAEKVVITRSK